MRTCPTVRYANAAAIIMPAAWQFARRSLSPRSFVCRYVCSGPATIVIGGKGTRKPTLRQIKNERTNERLTGRPRDTRDFHFRAVPLYDDSIRARCHAASCMRLRDSREIGIRLPHVRAYERENMCSLLRLITVTGRLSFVRISSALRCLRGRDFWVYSDSCVGLSG